MFEFYGSVWKMFGLYRIKHSLEWKVPNQDDWQNISTWVYAKYMRLHGDVLEIFGPSGLVILGLFSLCLLLLFAIYIKSIIDTFKSAKLELDASVPNMGEDELSYGIENEPDIREIANDNDEDEGLQNYIKPMSYSAEELERELSLDLLEASRAEAGEKEQEESTRKIKKRIRIYAETENARLEELKSYLKNKPRGEKQNSKNNDSSIVSLIINLLGRGVSVAKINQALYYHYKNDYDMHDIVHLVQSVCNFIGLCNAGKFDYLPHRQSLPENDAAIYAWAQGDYTLSLILLQAFLNQQMEQAQQESGIIKDMTYALAANCSCIMGDIAKLKDLELAHNSFELATELSPKNVTAWSRMGDIYMLEGSLEKAMIAYQNVIDIADKYLYAAEIAHAQSQLAAYYMDQELVGKAKQLKEKSEEFFNASGIYSNLTEKELLAYNVVYNGQQQNLRQSIYNLLNSYSF